jgi:hypothetical protein
MRTTLSIEDDLLDAVRRRAAELRLPLAEVVNRALRRGLAEDVAEPRSYATITFGDPGATFPSVEALLAADRDLDDNYLAAKVRPGKDDR